jgi:hypothetical protein
MEEQFFSIGEKGFYNGALCHYADRFLLGLCWNTADSFDTIAPFLAHLLQSGQPASSLYALVLYDFRRRK